MMFFQGKIVESVPCIFKDLKLIRFGKSLNLNYFCISFSSLAAFFVVVLVGRARE